MPVTHEPWLVALSVLVAVQGAYVGLSLCVLVAAAAGLKRRLLLAGASVSLAVAIWSMHFVGMLAARLPFPVDYLVFPTLLSFLVCALVVGAAVFAVSGGRLKAGRLAAAAVFMGAGIASMHYIGMTALHASAHMEHQPLLVVTSVVVAIAASGLALWLAAGRNRRPPLLLSATALGLAIASMHYTAMAGLTVVPHSHPQSLAPALSSDLLAIVVAIVAFVVSGIFLLALVPEPAAGLAARPVPAHSPPAAVEPPAQAGRGGYLPLGGVGAPPRRPAQQLPIEHDGRAQYLPVEAVVAVHANAHYTYLFDGKDRLFCPLAIGEVEARLDDHRFARVHRSHIVNLERVNGVKRAGDNGIVLLAAEQPYTVPVSRSRLAWLKGRLKGKAGGVFTHTHRFQAEDRSLATGIRQHR